MSTIYLNNSATSFPKPETVTNAVNKSLGQLPFLPGRSGFSEGKYDILSECRKSLANLFNVPDSSRIIFTSGATESLNMIIRGLDLDGMHVVTTAAEHNSVLRPLAHLKKDRNTEYTIITCDKNGKISLESVKEAFLENTRLVIINHCSNVTGALNDIDEIAEFAHAKGAYVLADISQSAGIYDIDLTKMDVDFAACTAHKYLFGIQGTGFLFIREGIEVYPLKTGGTGYRSDSVFQPSECPVFYEAGTMNMPGIVALKAGIDFIVNEGISKIQNHCRNLILHAQDKLVAIEGIAIYNSGLKTSVLSFSSDRKTPVDITYILENSFGIIIRGGLHCAPKIHEFIGSAPNGTCRISVSFFNTKEHIDKLIEAIKMILEC